MWRKYVFLHLTNDVLPCGYSNRDYACRVIVRVFRNTVNFSQRAKQLFQQTVFWTFQEALYQLCYYIPYIPHINRRLYQLRTSLQEAQHQLTTSLQEAIYQVRTYTDNLKYGRTDSVVSQVRSVVETPGSPKLPEIHWVFFNCFLMS